MSDPKKTENDDRELSDAELEQVAGGPTAVENVMSRAMLACFPPGSCAPGGSFTTIGSATGGAGAG